jgi:gamma-glutamylcyclotransferase (GGCT)/AIG2-like uncharacterized protein YtfP
VSAPGDLPAAQVVPSGVVRMFVNGEAMRARPLNTALSSARFLGPARSAPRYRFMSVRDEYPAMHPIAEGGGSVVGELYAVSYAVLRDHLLPREPAELELGVIELEDGSGTCLASLTSRSSAVGAATAGSRPLPRSRWPAGGGRRRAA